jgi:hypothetical protein
MTAQNKGKWQDILSRLAALLSLGGVAAALTAAIGSGTGIWHFGFGFTILRFAFFAAVTGGVIALVAVIVGVVRRKGVGKLNLLSFVVALLFSVYLLQMVATARAVPAIHDISTNLEDLPTFATLTVRPDNLENIPDEGRPELARLDPESRWKALHRRAYGDLRTVRVAGPVADATKRAAELARSRGWEIARVDPNAGIVEATATSFFFRFKDDVVVRVRPDPQNTGAAIVDMRSISRVGGSDVGINAKRIRDFLADLKSEDSLQP